MTATGQKQSSRSGGHKPDIEITDADFPHQERIEISEDDFPPTSSPTNEPEEGRRFAKVLGIKGQVTRDDVRRAYHELASQYHPDKVQHLGPKLREVADNEMRAINEAYAYFRQRYNF